MIRITPQQLQQIKAHAQRIYPDECCGLLLGQITNDERIVIEVRETENSWTDELEEGLVSYSGTKRDRFYIAPEVLLHVQKEVRERQLSIIGVYHSHPDHLAIPSAMDQDIAWPEYSYIIVALNQSQISDLQCWKLDSSGQFKPEVILTEIIK